MRTHSKTEFEKALDAKRDELLSRVKLYSETEYNKGIELSLKQYHSELIELSKSFPTSENIERFELLCSHIKAHYNNASTNEFKNVIDYLTKIYMFNISPEWRLIAANNIFLMYHNTFTNNNVNVWAQTNYGKCLEWASNVNRVKISDEAILFDDETARDYKLKTVHWVKMVEKEQASVKILSETYSDEINKTYNNLVDLVKTYRGEEGRSKFKSSNFDVFNDILNASGKSNYERIHIFHNTLLKVDGSLGHHRTAEWKRFFWDAMSFLAFLVPAAWRAISSYSKYGTIDFFEPESKRAVDYAKENISNLFKLFQDKKYEPGKRIEASVEQRIQTIKPE